VRDDAGVVALWVAIMTPLLFMLCAFAVDVARWYVEGARVQKAADAAALSGVSYMPANLNVTTPSATSTAIDFASRNGYTDNNGTIDVQVAQGPKNTQLQVTITSTITNGFASIFGFRTQGITRTAIADFNGPAPMGSPCNTFGTEPAGTSGAPPASSQLASTTGCVADPQFWATIEGPATEKVQGDRYATRNCDGGEDGCDATVPTNADYRTDGYTYVIRVRPDSTGNANTGAITVQLYDPAYVFTGPECEALPNGGWVNNHNTFTPGSDAATRYNDVAGGYCTGDYDPGFGGGSGTPRMDTTFVLKSPTSTLDPSQATVVDSSCVKQYRGFTSAPTNDTLRRTNGSYNIDLARVFHQWNTLCTIDNPVPGDYYLQVRTNASMPGSDAIVTGAGAATSPSESNTTGRGNNAFGIRAYSSTIPSANSRINVAGWERMPLFVNRNNVNANFKLIRVPSAAAGKSLQFTFFDTADASGNGDVRIIPPSDATGTITTLNASSSTVKCIGTGVVGGTSGSQLSRCEVGVSSSANNGKLQTITVPIPTDYVCDDTLSTGCWFDVRFRFPGAQPTDISTWSATILGDPIRIIK
jgi:hypothetical protein